MKKDVPIINKLVWLIVGFGLGGVVIGLFLGLNGRLQPAPIYITPPAPTATAVVLPTPSAIAIFVNGEVANPALYELPTNSRVEQAVAAAGGFTSDANQAVVNLAQPLSDGAQVFVPSLTDAVVIPAAGVSSSAPVVESESATAVTGGLVNINTATLEQLDSLPGIGPSTAQKILDYRGVNGNFPTIEAIKNVSGIGDAKFEAIQDLITVQ